VPRYSSAAASDLPDWCRHGDRGGRSAGEEAQAEEAQVHRPGLELREAARAIPARACAGSRWISSRAVRAPGLGAPPRPDERAILTILTQNSADVNAEVAFEALRQPTRAGSPAVPHHPGAGWGGVGYRRRAARLGRIEFAPIPS
jgi:hypothetical protein